MSVLAAIRPDDWNLPLLVHVFGAMMLVGGLVTAAAALLYGWRRDAGWYTRLAFWSLLAIAFPAWWVMRIGAEWIYSKENFDEDNEPGWIGVGYLTAEPGGLLLLVTIILTGIGYRRLRSRPDAESSMLTRIGGVLAVVLLVAYTIAVWAMTAKPD
jgi:hypothetical protein